MKIANYVELKKTQHERFSTESAVIANLKMTHFYIMRKISKASQVMTTNYKNKQQTRATKVKLFDTSSETTRKETRWESNRNVNNGLQT